MPVSQPASQQQVRCCAELLCASSSLKLQQRLHKCSPVHGFSEASKLARKPLRLNVGALASEMRHSVRLLCGDTVLAQHTT